MTTEPVYPFDTARHVITEHTILHVGGGYYTGKGILDLFARAKRLEAEVRAERRKGLEEAAQIVELGLHAHPQAEIQAALTDRIRAIRARINEDQTPC